MKSNPNLELRDLYLLFALSVRCYLSRQGAFEELDKNLLEIFPALVQCLEKRNFRGFAPSTMSGNVEPSILIVERDPSIRKLLMRVLKRTGYVVHGLADHSNLHEELIKHKVNLIIADFDLPERAVWETAYAIQRAFPKLGMILTSAGELSDDSALYPLVLQKPFRLSFFLGCVQTLLRPAQFPI